MSSSSRSSAGPLIRSAVCVLGLISLASGEPLGDGTAFDSSKLYTKDNKQFAVNLEGRALVEKAIHLVNALLGARPEKLVAVWHKATKMDDAGRGSSAIPVHSVQHKDRTRTLPAFVPQGCRCIVVDTLALSHWLSRHSADETTQLSLDADHSLAFILLHEVGHIVHGDASGRFENGGYAELNIDPSYAKAREQRADKFAADILRSLIQARQPNSATTAAAMVAMELTKLSWNMQSHRSLQNFGATAIGAPDVFFDRSLTHPNLEWRILNLNNLILQTKEAQALLDAFETARQSGADPKPLYQRQSP